VENASPFIYEIPLLIQIIHSQNSGVRIFEWNRNISKQSLSTWAAQVFAQKNRNGSYDRSCFLHMVDITGA